MTRLVSTAKGIGRLEDDGETVALLDLDAPDIGAALQSGLDIASIVTAAVRDRIPMAQAQLAAPVPRPSKIWAVGYAYAGHRTEVGYAGTAEDPVIFLKAPSSVIGTGERIRLPKAAPDEVDYEGELAVVIGRRATDVPEADAYSFVAGFTICNDVSARDVQKGRVPGRAANVTAAKSFDTFTPWAPPWPRSTSSPILMTCTCAPGSRASSARTRVPPSSFTRFPRWSPTCRGRRPSNPAT